MTSERDINVMLEELRLSQKELQATALRQFVLLERIAASSTRQEWRQLLREIENPHRLEHFGQKVYSQNDEDGILGEILRRLAITPASGSFVEFGVENGLQNNTHYLLRHGFRGVWMENSASSVQRIEKLFYKYLAATQLTVREVLITAENIEAEIMSLVPDRNVAVLSIDVDGNDYWIWQAIASIAPAVVVVEYNGKFPPPLSVVQKYRPDRVWKGTDYFGASLSALVKLGESKGYRLVGCNITGQNAFFVRSDLIASHFPYELTAEHLYQPCRYDLTYGCFGSAGHRPDVGTYVFV